MLLLPHRKHFGLCVTTQFCVLTSQGCDRPWRLPADAPNSLHLVSQASSSSLAHALLIA
ncbi:hypothetical protein [Ktedonospora formicarum]|uniref:hypothetical protein n=1 Tax=Ktedonospora formicarum TaxID=2778364 RepID=UPI001C68E120|nr:hypothetical protein [Ktedonospora formicarum]